MSRTNVVKCVPDHVKSGIQKLFETESFNTKKELAKQYGISTRTLGRILSEKKDTSFDYCITRGEISIIKDGVSRTIDSSYPNFKKFKKSLVKGNFSDVILSDVFDAMELKTIIEDFSEGNLTVSYENECVYYGAFEIRNSLVDHILRKLENGEDVTGFVRFMDKLMANPKQDIVEELYGFMKDNNISIDDEGFIIAYRGVRSNYYDRYSNTILNKVGCHPVMPRHMVEHNPTKACGAGLHAGSYDYAKSWAGSGRLMKVKIHPADVCSVPWDCDSQKMRTCGYLVVDEVM
ncbi:RIIB lysis inhibitor [Vibrio phage 11895-B1]|uniref:RIIB lysis inhibitor n=1 Tax=Vibrio phage 11895-B1 TaxID=754075 RepID=UPI0002C05E0D|nr:RIIB lysis inhibitor [Vibrio phage 11895-B1]AGH32097.1 rIIB membrane-associated protein [Vibrio phage 11895-B1]